VWEAAAQGQMDFLRQLSSDDLQLPDELFRTPLMLAAANNRHEAVRFLLEGATVGSTDQDSGWTALHHALQRGCLVNAAMIFREGGDLYHPDYEGVTPADLVSSCCEKDELDVTSSDRSQSESSEHTRETAQDCAEFLYTLGYARNDQLGYVHTGATALHSRPRLVEDCDEKLADLCVTNAFNTMANGRGDVYVWGRGLGGLLGNGTASGAAIVPQRVQTLAGIKRVSLDGTNAAALNDKGEVFQWGRMRFWAEASMDVPTKDKSVTWTQTSSRTGSLFESVLLSRPVKLMLPKCAPVRSITAAANALYFVTSDGVAWALGQHIDTQRVELTPRPIQALQSLKVAVSDISANSSCVCALTNNGEVFQQDCLASTFHRVHFPKLTGFRQPALRVVKVCVPSSSFSHKQWQRAHLEESQKALALTNRGEVFWWPLPVSAPASAQSASQVS